MVSQVRRFNRIVTQRVGALDDRFLARDRPLGEARLLWEIGPGGCDVRVLRARLRLASRYLSPLLPSLGSAAPALSRRLRPLEPAGLAVVEPTSGDKRVRTVRLTRAGAAERSVLDRRS